MTSKNMKTKEMFDRLAYSKLLSTISMPEVKLLEFQLIGSDEWQPMVVCADKLKSMYLCKVCNVFQYGDKNLVGHLSGKKHNFKMEIVRNVDLPKDGLSKVNVSKDLRSKNVRTTIDDKRKDDTSKIYTNKAVNSQKNTYAMVNKKAVTNKEHGSANSKNKFVRSVQTIKKVQTISAQTVVNTEATKISEAKSNVVIPSKQNLPNNDASKKSTAKPASLPTNKPISSSLASKGAVSAEIAKEKLPDSKTPMIGSTVPATNGATIGKLIPKPSAPQYNSAKSGAAKEKLPDNKTPITSSTASATNDAAIGKLIPNTQPSDLQANSVRTEVAKEKLADSNTPMIGSAVPTPIVAAKVKLLPKSKPLAPKVSEATGASKNKPSITIISNKIIPPSPQLKNPNEIAQHARPIETGIPTSKSAKELNSKSAEKVIDCIDVDGLIDKVIIDKEPIKTPHSAVVLNPLSSVAAKQRKISCVPLSMLVEAKPLSVEPINVNENVADDDSILVLPEPETALTKTTEQLNKTKKIVGKEVMNVDFGDNSLETMLPCSQALLGVEYVIKIVRTMNDKNPKFHCSLCNIATDEIAMHNHLVSYSHRIKYCEKYFPTAVRHYKQYIRGQVPDHLVIRVMTPILEKLATAIENHHGRETAYLCYESSYMRSRYNVTSTVYNRKHASELQGPSFIHTLDLIEVDMLIKSASSSTYRPPTKVVVPNFTFETANIPTDVYRNRTASTKSSDYSMGNDTNMTETVDDETHKRMVENFLRDTRQSKSLRKRRDSRNSKRSCSRSNSIERKKKRLSPKLKCQWNLERRSLSPLRDGDIWQAYRHMVDQKVRELNASFDLYKSDPEEHPLYNEEWQKFWKRRKDELVADGINHRTYNFQGEWIIFFNTRLEELYTTDVEGIKLKCRERLCLPMTNSELLNPRYHVHITDYIDEAFDNVTDNNYPDNVTSTVSANDYDNLSDNAPTNFLDNMFKNLNSAKNLNSVRNLHSVETHRDNVVKGQVKPNDQSVDVNVIHVLRLLTALEDFLGSLGPSVTDLLVKALQTSKQNPDKVDHIILTRENCSILETAKEKFTGLIISKILDSVQERAVRRAIKDTDTLLKYADKIRAESASRNMESNIHMAQRVESLRNSSTLHQSLNKSYKKPDHKAELVSKLASKLISEGKTSINQEQLQEIVQVYSLIQQKANNNQTASSSSSHINPRNSNNSGNTECVSNQMMTSDFSNMNTTSASYSSAKMDHGSYNSSSSHIINPRNSNISGSTERISNQMMTSDFSNMNTTSESYSSANMDQGSYNSNKNNSNNMQYFRNGQEYQHNQQFNQGIYTNRESTMQLNFNYKQSTMPINYMDTNYSYEDTTGSGQPMRWM